LVEITLTDKPTVTVGPLEMFGESALKENARRQGSAKCVKDTTCLIIGKKDIEKSLGSSIRNLIYYNIQKWALVRTQVFNSYNSS